MVLSGRIGTLDPELPQDQSTGTEPVQRSQFRSRSGFWVLGSEFVCVRVDEVLTRTVHGSFSSGAQPRGLLTVLLTEWIMEAVQHGKRSQLCWPRV